MSVSNRRGRVTRGKVGNPDLVFRHGTRAVVSEELTPESEELGPKGGLLGPWTVVVFAGGWGFHGCYGTTKYGWGVGDPLGFC